MTLRCLFHGHEWILDYGPNKVSCRCLICGRRTAGVQIEPKPLVYRRTETLRAGEGG